MTRPTSAAVIRRAHAAGFAIPAFNVPYLPMIEPVVQALRDTRCFGFVAVARLEWEKFEAGGPRPVREEYERVKDERFTRLHLDHTPVIDEDLLAVDYMAIIEEAIALGYDSVMVDGSRLAFEENVEATRRVVHAAHEAGIPAEAELGAVLGHESGPLPDYEELFASGRGFTDVDEARRFVELTGVDWLSVAVGNIHGAISGAAKSQKKPAARLSIPHLQKLVSATRVPLVLHGGSGIRRESLHEGMRNGIAKINVGTTLRQAYEAAIPSGPDAARRAVYEATTQVIRDELALEGTADRIPEG
ncbi:MAG: class II fructose-bisphosphate aldolase [Chthonomonadales bacterium]|nr:class II fructose-bisphosphate aldolase [Chthonomonadales bacterium]